MQHTLKDICAAMREYDLINAPGSESNAWQALCSETATRYGVEPWHHTADSVIVSDDFASFWLAIAASDYDKAALYGDVPQAWRDDDLGLAAASAVTSAAHGDRKELDALEDSIKDKMVVSACSCKRVFFDVPANAGKTDCGNGIVVWQWACPHCGSCCAAMENERGPIAVDAQNLFAFSRG